jgi:hypothetical protein
MLVHLFKCLIGLLFKLLHIEYCILLIANNLDIKQNTVSTIKKNIFDKLKIENLVELIDIIKTHHKI